MHLKPRIHPDSVITMADGSRKSITEIKIGDEVQTYDMNSEEFDAANIAHNEQTTTKIVDNTNKGITTTSNTASNLIKGSLIIFAPLFFHFDETLKVFEVLMLSKTFITFLETEHWIINVCIFLSFVGYIYFAYKNKFQDFEVLFLDMLSIIILNYIFSPIIAFTVYFCFLHSIRHIISLSNELDKNNFSNGMKIFIKKALPLTVVTAILYLIATIFLSKSYGLNDVIIKVIFIGLASLTFPHILLEYLLEINEKRN